MLHPKALNHKTALVAGPSVLDVVSKDSDQGHSRTELFVSFVGKPAPGGETPLVTLLGSC